MLDRMMSEYSKWKQQLNSVLFRHKRLTPSENLCAITLSSTEFSLAYTRNATGKIDLEFCASYPYDPKESFKTTLSAIVKEHNLKKANCAWVLAPDDYQLLQIDALPVTAAEFQAAIRWKIKELLHFPIEDVVVDQFPIPAGKAGSKDKIMVIAAQASYLQKISEEIKGAGLDISIIDIPELALCNILALSEHETNTQALIYVQEKTMQLFITCHKQLFFTRNLEFSWDLSATSPDDIKLRVEQLAAEIQRSLDYYQNQWRQTNPLHITIASTMLIPVEIMNQLSQTLAIPIQLLDLGEVLLSKQAMNLELQGKYLPIIGELFRKENEQNAATD